MGRRTAKSNNRMEEKTHHRLGLFDGPQRLETFFISNGIVRYRQENKRAREVDSFLAFLV